MAYWSEKLTAANLAYDEARRIETENRVRKYCESVADLNHYDNDFDSPQIAAEERAAAEEIAAQRQMDAAPPLAAPEQPPIIGDLYLDVDDDFSNFNFNRP